MLRWVVVPLAPERSEFPPTGHNLETESILAVRHGSIEVESRRHSPMHLQTFRERLSEIQGLACLICAIFGMVLSLGVRL